MDRTYMNLLFQKQKCHPKVAFYLLLVARGRIEPPTQGFSRLASDHERALSRSRSDAHEAISVQGAVLPFGHGSSACQLFQLG